MTVTLKVYLLEHFRLVFLLGFWTYCFLLGLESIIGVSSQLMNLGGGEVDLKSKATMKKILPKALKRMKVTWKKPI